MSPDTATPITHAIKDREELAAARLQLLTAARYKLAFHLPSLPAEAFSSPAELDELRRVAVAGRNAEIRIILGDIDAVLRAGHRLLDLLQRLPSAIQIRTPVSEDDSGAVNTALWAFNDTNGYFFLPDAARPEGRAATADGAGQAPLRQDFEQIWQRAEPASRLLPLGL